MRSQPQPRGRLISVIVAGGLDLGIKATTAAIVILVHYRSLLAGVEVNGLPGATYKPLFRVDVNKHLRPCLRENGAGFNSELGRK